MLAITIPFSTVIFFTVLYASLFKINKDLSFGDYEIDNTFYPIISALTFLSIFYMAYSLRIIKRGLSR
jgi:hypothetical protein